MTGETVVARARAALGVPFRWHGRALDSGLDRVGLVAFAGGLGIVPTGYRPRAGAGGAGTMMIAAGFFEVAEAGAGDVLLCESGPGQVHLAVATGRGLIHADAGLGRVVERPGPVPWPVLSCWRAG